jgi:hypothetical protein
MIESNNVATLNVGRDPAVEVEKRMIESNNAATLNVGRLCSQGGEEDD